MSIIAPVITLLFAARVFAESGAPPNGALLEDAVFEGALASASAVVLDAASLAVLFEKNAALPIPPASLTKLVTMHIAMDAAESGRASLSDVAQLPPETWARNQPRGSSLMFLDQGQTVTLHELLLGLAIPSGNDAAVALALHFAPSIEGFARIMNTKMRDMRLFNTKFVEPSGISEENITTALDFALFCAQYVKLHPYALQDYHTVKEFAYPEAKNLPLYQQERQKPIVQPNHIPLLGIFDGVDGLKTGYIDEAGYNAAVTATRDGTRFIVVTMGVSAELGPRRGSAERTADCKKLLDWAFASYKTLSIDAPLLKPVRIWKGAKKEVNLRIDEIVATTIPVTRGDEVRSEIEMDFPLIAPLPEGTRSGVLRLYDSTALIREIPLVTAEEVARGGFFRRLFDSIALLFKR